MAAGADTARENNVLFSLASLFSLSIPHKTHRSRIDSNTIILIVNIGPSNRNTSARSNIKTISISTKRITSRIVDRDIRKRKCSSTIDTEDLDRSIKDVDTGDGRGDQVMGFKELGLGLSITGRAFAVPVVLSVLSV